jgi:hypothetical protein
VIAALTSRAAALSKTSTPDEAHLLQQARREGVDRATGSTTRITSGALPRKSRRVLKVAWSGVAPDGMVAFPRLELMLARNNADWYQLLDLCALTDRLIAELIRSRLTVGLRHKAARGELRQLLLRGRLRCGK